MTKTLLFVAKHKIIINLKFDTIREKCFPSLKVIKVDTKVNELPFKTKRKRD